MRLVVLGFENGSAWVMVVDRFDLALCGSVMMKDEDKKEKGNKNEANKSWHFILRNITVLAMEYQGIQGFDIDILLPGPIISRHCLTPFPVEARCTNQATYSPFPSRLVRISIGGDSVLYGQL